MQRSGGESGRLNESRHRELFMVRGGSDSTTITSTTNSNCCCRSSRGSTPTQTLPTKCTAPKLPLLLLNLIQNLGFTAN